jgi:hypothetical protein
MPPRAVPITLTASERKSLKGRVRGAKTPYRDRVRSQSWNRDISSIGMCLTPRRGLPAISSAGVLGRRKVLS